MRSAEESTWRVLTPFDLGKESALLWQPRGLQVGNHHSQLVSTTRSWTPRLGGQPGRPCDVSGSRYDRTHRLSYRRPFELARGEVLRSLRPAWTKAFRMSERTGHAMTNAPCFLALRNRMLHAGL